MSCEFSVGAVNNPNTVNDNSLLAPYIPYVPQTGTMDLASINPSFCSNTDQIRQEQYVAEMLNISGAPIHIYKMLGVHEQADGVLLGDYFSSTPYPGLPAATVNSLGWKSLFTGQDNVMTPSYIGIDFGIKSPNAYNPNKSAFTKVGSVSLIQSASPNEFASQVRVETTDGSLDIKSPTYFGNTSGYAVINGLGVNASEATVFASFNGVSFDIMATLISGLTVSLGTAQIGKPFFSTYANFTINHNSFTLGDAFQFEIKFIWKRAGVFPLIQSPTLQILNFQTELLVRAVRVIPTMFSGNGNWVINQFNAHEYIQTGINNIQDLFFGENRDREYSKQPLLIKAQYSLPTSSTDFSKFGLNILDSYSFNVSFASMVSLLGRPIVTGDIIEVIPEMQYDHNLKPIRKFLEVTDTSWAAEGFTHHWRPTIYQFHAQQALPSQETKDIFGSIDANKYLTLDSIIDGGIGMQVDTTPLTATEQIIADAANRVPETGSDDEFIIESVPLPQATKRNEKGNPEPANPINNAKKLYIEDGLPKNGELYGEGYSLPDVNQATDGEYFRLNYPPSIGTPSRLYRFSIAKNRWIYQETDKRGKYSSHKPSAQAMFENPINIRNKL